MFDSSKQPPLAAITAEHIRGVLSTRKIKKLLSKFNPALLEHFPKVWCTSRLLCPDLSVQTSSVRLRSADCGGQAMCFNFFFFPVWADCPVARIWWLLKKNLMHCFTHSVCVYKWCVYRPYPSRSLQCCWGGMKGSCCMGCCFWSRASAERFLVTSHEPVH